MSYSEFGWRTQLSVLPKKEKNLLVSKTGIFDLKSELYAKQQEKYTGHGNGGEVAPAYKNKRSLRDIFDDANKGVSKRAHLDEATTEGSSAAEILNLKSRKYQQLLTKGYLSDSSTHSGSDNTYLVQFREKSKNLQEFESTGFLEDNDPQGDEYEHHQALEKNSDDIRLDEQDYMTREQKVNHIWTQCISHIRKLKEIEKDPARKKIDGIGYITRDDAAAMLAYQDWLRTDLETILEDQPKKKKKAKTQA